MIPFKYHCVLTLSHVFAAVESWKRDFNKSTVFPWDGFKHKYCVHVR